MGLRPPAPRCLLGSPLDRVARAAVWALLDLDQVGSPKSVALTVEFCVFDTLGLILAYVQLFSVDPRVRTPGTIFQLSLCLAGVAVSLGSFHAISACRPALR